jgi:hypothetical protein
MTFIFPTFSMEARTPILVCGEDLFSLRNENILSDNKPAYSLALIK